MMMVGRIRRRVSGYKEGEGVDRVRGHLEARGQ